MHVDPVEALVAFLLWLCIGLAVALLVGRVLRVGEQPPVEDDEPCEVGKLLHFDCERRRRTRSDARNGLGGAA